MALQADICLRRAGLFLAGRNGDHISGLSPEDPAERLFCRSGGSGRNIPVEPDAGHGPAEAGKKGDLFLRLAGEKSNTRRTAGKRDLDGTRFFD